MREALADALGDPSLKLAFAVADEGFVDARGHRVELPPPEAGRTTTIVATAGRPIAALVHDRFLLDEPELVEASAAAARLVLENLRLQVELQAQLVQVRESRARIRRISNLFAPTLTASTGLPRANWGAYVTPLGGTATTALQTTRQFEPASAIKAVINLHIMRRIQTDAGNPSGEKLTSSFVYYNYPNSPYNAGTKDACPIVSDEVAANQLASTVDVGKDPMMAISDNRTTRNFVLRYGLTALNTTARTTAGMSSTAINQDRMGCGWVGDKQNRTTLTDLGRLYEGVENSSLLSGSYRTEFYQPMNGNTFDTTDPTENAIRNVVADEAAKQGKSVIASQFISRMNWRYKPGGYNIPCSSSTLTNCTQGQLYFPARAGRLTLPIKTGPTTSATRNYVFGQYIDSLNLGCTGCISPTAADSVFANVSTELFRDIIASALQTW